MKLTKKGEYTLRAMIQLGIAQRVGRDTLSVPELVDSNRLPFKFVERILGELRGAGYVESQRGKDGGYRIAKPLGDITMGELVRLIDGRLAPIGCASETDYAPCSCPDEDHCGLRMLMIDVRNAIARILDRYTLHDVVEVTLRKMLRDGTDLPFATPEPADPGDRRPPNPADPAAGFLAGLGILTEEGAGKTE